MKMGIEEVNWKEGWNGGCEGDKQGRKIEIDHVEDMKRKAMPKNEKDESGYLWAIGGTNDHHSG